MAMFTMDHLESSRRGDAMWIAPENIRVSRDSRAVAGALRELGLERATIGVGLEPHPPWHPEGIVPYHLWNKVIGQFPNAVFKPAAFALARLMMTLGEQEIAVVRHSASIGDAMALAMVDAAGPGVCESEVYAAGMATAYARGTVVAGMHFWSGPDPVASGPPPWAYRPQAPRVLQDGDVISAEVFCAFGGRHTQHQVLIAIGDIHDDFERAASVARAAYDAGLRALRPGRTFGEVAAEMDKPLKAADGWVFGPAIHGINPLIALGGFPGDMSRLPGAEVYSPVTDQATILGDMQLEPGMCFAFEPNYAFGRHLVHIGGTAAGGEPHTARIGVAAESCGRPGSRSAEAMQLLGTWAATQDIEAANDATSTVKPVSERATTSADRTYR